MSDKHSFLPLGAAVKVQDDDDVYVLISRAFMQSAEGEILTGYQAVIYPVGHGSQIPLQVVYGSEITEVLSTGYSDNREDGFVEQRLQELRDRIESADEEDDAPEETNEQDEEDVLTHEERLAEDPFYKFRK